MFETRITKQFGLGAPILNAGMAFVAGPELAAAVSNAGGLGMLGGALLPPEGLRALIGATRKLTDRRFGVDVIGDFSSDAHIDVLTDEQVALAVFFWTAPTPAQVARLKAAHVAFWMQVGSVAEARTASALGAEALVVQGSESGGHNRAEATLANLLPAVRAALPDMPLLAIAAYRHAEAHARPELAAPLGGLARAATRLPLEGLGRDDVGLLAAARARGLGAGAGAVKF